MRHVQIEDQQVGVLGMDGSDGQSGIRQSDHVREAIPLEDVAQESDDSVRVVDDHYPSGPQGLFHRQTAVLPARPGWGLDSGSSPGEAAFLLGEGNFRVLFSGLPGQTGAKRLAWPDGYT